MSRLRAVKLPSHENLFAAGQIIDRWQLTAMVGRGGSSEVYRAIATDGSGEVVAIKFLLNPDVYSARIRFAREAALLREHGHRTLPTYISEGEFCSRPYLVTEFLEPYKLPTTDKAIAKFILELADGASYLHALGYVHRDIKPNNIMSRAGTPILIDFGLIKDFTNSEVVTSDTISVVDGRMMGLGTPNYSAPEQFAGGVIAPYSDVHAIGVLIDQCFQSKPPRLWQTIIQKATSSRTALRYKSIKDLTRAIRRRHYPKLSLVAMLLVAIASAAITYVIKGQPQRPAAPRIDYAAALGIPNQESQSSPHKPWRVVEGSVYEGQKAIVSTGGEGGNDKTWLEVTLPEGVKTMTVVFNKIYYKCRFSIEVDGVVKYSDSSVSPIGQLKWLYQTISLPPNSKKVKFIYEHKGVGYRYQHNGVCIDSIYFDQKVISDSERDNIITKLLGSLKPIPGQKYLAMTNEVTQSLWEAIMVTNPSKNKDGDPDILPVENFSWFDLRIFLDRLNAQAVTAKYAIRPPTREEWEYTCKAGSTNAYTRLIDGTEVNITNLHLSAWYKDNSGSTTQPICQKLPNAYGMYDMLGNVSEWVMTAEDGKIVYCGGNWSSSSNECQTLHYRRNDLVSPLPELGIRLFADPVRK